MPVIPTLDSLLNLEDAWMTAPVVAVEADTAVQPGWDNHGPLRLTRHATTQDAFLQEEVFQLAARLCILKWLTLLCWQGEVIDELPRRRVCHLRSEYLFVS